MKKFTAILLTVIMVASLFISCNNSIAPTVTDETVSVSFTEATSRRLTASLDDFRANDYFWAYKAEKTDSTGLNSGATSFAWVKNEGTGLSGVKIPGFSQGAWKFTLYAYKTRVNSDTNLAYSGEANTVLTKGGNNTVAVTVSPSSTGTGTLVVKINDIKIKKFDGTVLENDSQNGFTKEVSIVPMASDGGEVLTPKTGEDIPDYTYDAKPGAYKVSVGLKQDGIIFASGSVVATVYANLTTTVSGTLQEQITDASFDPSRNPDVLNLVASSDSIDYAQKADDALISLASPKAVGETESRITAVVKAQAGKNLVADLASEDGAGSAALKNAAKRETTLALSVDTISASEGSVSYEIGLSATITSRDSNGNITATEVYTVNNLKDYLTATMKLQPGLSNVVVTHNSQTMQKLNSLEETITNDNGAYHYAIDSGNLTIITKRFSPFEVKYSKFIAEMSGRKYATVQEAINAAPVNAGDSVSTITLLEDVTEGAAFGFSDLMAGSGRNICIDLNGKKYTFKNPAMGSQGYETQAMHLAHGNKLTLKNGTIEVTSDTTPIKRMIQNYCDLTLENVTVNCSNVSDSYNNSICRGSLTVKGNTRFIASSDTAKIFDVDGAYCDKNNCDVSVVFDETYTGTTTGVIEYVPSANGHTSSLIIKGGTFSFDPSAYVPAYCMVTENGTYTVSMRTEGAVQIGDRYYEYFESAITDAATGETLKFLEDITVNKTLRVPQDIVIDLNGRTLNANAEFRSSKSGSNHIITIKNGTVNVKDSSFWWNVFKNEVTINLEDLTVNATKASAVFRTQPSSVSHKLTINADADTVIDGTFLAGDPTYSANEETPSVSNIVVNGVHVNCTTYTNATRLYGQYKNSKVFAEFNNCIFECTKGGNLVYCGAKPAENGTVSVKMTDCQLKAKYTGISNAIYGYGREGIEVVLNNCTDKDGNVITVQ